MRILRTPKWSIPERLATPESVYLSRRGLLRTGAGVAAALLPKLIGAAAREPLQGEAHMYPAERNAKFTLDREVTAEQVAAHNNIFDEFAGDHELVWQAAKNFKTHPWRIQIGGLVPKQLNIDVEELVARLGLEERLYRHRCVEAWAMAVPWTGIPLRKLVELAAPLTKAKYLRMVAAALPAEMPDWYATRRVFPYYEALTLAEATNELAFLATGIYGHSLPPQHGAPLRLVVPWKYGLKSIKSIVAFQFTEERPGTFWNELSPHNYSFFCNVDPKETVPWSQAEEEMLGTKQKRPTLPYNGYGEWVAALYA